MKQWFVLFLLTTITCLGVSSESVAAEFRHKWYKVNINYEDDVWTRFNDLERYQLLALKHEDGITSLNVFAYTYAEPPTINGFQERRKTSGYDGWVNLGERMGTDFESKRANVEDSYLSIYSKKTLNAQLQMESWVVAEYYYVKETKGYVVSIRTRRELWKSVQDTFKEVVESFWVGDGEKPQVARVKTSETDLEMVGANPENQMSNDVNFDPESNAAFYWEFRSEYDRSDGAPLFAKGAIYAAEEGRVRSFSIYDGKVRWEYEIDGEVDTSLVYHNGRVFFVEEMDEGAKLTAITASKGTLEFSTDLPGNDYLSPIASSGRLLVMGNGVMVAYSASDGAELWQFPMSGGTHFYPVGSRDYVVAVEGRSKLHLIQGKNGNPYWSQLLGADLVFSPMVVKDMLLVPQLKTSGTGDYVSITSLNLTQGSQLWSFEAKGYEARLLAPPSTAGDLYFLSLSRNGRDHLLAIDVNTGEMAWSKNWDKLDVDFGAQPVVTGTGIYLAKNENLSDALDISVLNNRTGEEDETFTVSLPSESGRGNLRYLKVYKSALFLITDKNKLEIVATQ